MRWRLPSVACVESAGLRRLFLGERLTVPNWLGVGLIAAGTILVAYRS